MESIFNSYGHLSGLIMGENAKQEAPWIRSHDLATEENPYPVFDLGVMKAFFKALDDAPTDRVDYASRFMEKYAGEALRVWP